MHENDIALSELTLTHCCPPISCIVIKVRIYIVSPKPYTYLPWFNPMLPSIVLEFKQAWKSDYRFDWLYNSSLYRIKLKVGLRVCYYVNTYKIIQKISEFCNFKTFSSNSSMRNKRIIVKGGIFPIIHYYLGRYSVDAIGILHSLNQSDVHG